MTQVKLFPRKLFAKGEESRRLLRLLVLGREEGSSEKREGPPRKGQRAGSNIFFLIHMCSSTPAQEGIQRCLSIPAFSFQSNASPRENRSVNQDQSAMIIWKVMDGKSRKMPHAVHTSPWRHYSSQRLFHSASGPPPEALRWTHDRGGLLENCPELHPLHYPLVKSPFQRPSSSCHPVLWGCTGQWSWEREKEGSKETFWACSQGWVLTHCFCGFIPVKFSLFPTLKKKVSGFHSPQFQ